MGFWHEFIAFCFELELPKIEPIILDEPFYHVEFETTIPKIIREVKVLMFTFDIDCEHCLTGETKYIKFPRNRLKLKRYKEFTDALEILVADYRVDKLV